MNGKGSRKVFIEAYSSDYYQHQLTVQDDISSWNTGDEFVIASTDYDWQQAERFTIQTIEGKTIFFEACEQNNLDYVHYSNVYEGVEMRAEVAMLTRNVKIHGEMEDGCYGEETNACGDNVDFDNFGGHIMAVMGFESFNIEGAEVYHMGQMTVKGRYPIHFHMALDTARDGVRQGVRGNSIHDTFRYFLPQTNKHPYNNALFQPLCNHPCQPQC